MNALNGTVYLPGSKSESNRALVISALSRHSQSLYPVSTAEDTQIFLDFLAKAGYIISRTGSRFQVSGNATPGARFMFDLKQAGTALRFLPALTCMLPVEVTFTGTDRLSQRPFDALGQALQDAGAQLHFPSSAQALPCWVKGQAGWQPEVFRLHPGLSSQLLSALLLLAPRLTPGCRICTPPESVVSRPYLDMTLSMLARAGYVWEELSDGWVLRRSNPSFADILIDGDWSAASYFLALAATRPANLYLYPLRINSLQGDRRQLAWFRQWGLSITPEGEGIRVVNQGNTIVPAFDYDFSAMPDLAQTFAILALYASEPCTLSGLHTLRHKETDRIQALAETLTALGAVVETQQDSLRISPLRQKPQLTRIPTFDDHRMAMAFALLTADFPELEIENPEVVRKSFPDFWVQWNQLMLK